MQTDPVPSGESAPPSLEERKPTIHEQDVAVARRWLDGSERLDRRKRGKLSALLGCDAREMARLTAEVARLAAGWEAEVHRAGELRAALDEAGVAVQRVNGRLVALPTRTTARLIAAEAEAARYREALEKIAGPCERLVVGRCTDPGQPYRDDAEYLADLTCDACIATRALTTEGGDHAEH